MADLVRDDVAQAVVDEALGLGAVGCNLAAALQQLESELHLAIGVDREAAEVARAAQRIEGVGRRGLRQRIADRLPAAARPALRDHREAAQDLAGARIGLRPADGGCVAVLQVPAQGDVARPFVGVPVGIGRLLAHVDGVLVARALEGLVPLQRPLAHRRAVFLRDVLVHPHDDRLLRLRHGGRRILLLETPAADVVRVAQARWPRSRGRRTNRSPGRRADRPRVAARAAPAAARRCRRPTGRSCAHRAPCAPASAAACRVRARSLGGIGSLGT